MIPLHIDDPQDRRLDDYRNLPDGEILRKRGIFIAEGRLVVRRLLTGSRFAARSVLVTPTALEALVDLLNGTALPVYVVPQAVMNGITGFHIHRGCLAIGERPPTEAWRALVQRGRRIVLLERVGNADNVGSVFRNAAAFGADAVLLGADCADPLYRKAIRTSMGAALTVPFAPATPWPAMLHELKDLDYHLVGLTPDRCAPELDAALPTGRERIALVLGHEGDGLTADVMNLCSTLAQIPMAGHVDSLNVATAAAIALYEMTRRPEAS
jgi:tRNA G18 (ribose-2'-O)-methylase SpoU